MSTPGWYPLGTLKGPPGPPGPSWEVLPFSMHGQLRTTAGTGRFPIKGGEFSLETVAAAVQTAPLGSPVVLDVLVNGVSIYAGHPERRPTIAPGQRDAVVGAHNPTVVADGDALNCDVVAVGNALPGAFLVAVVRLQQIVAVAHG